VRFDATPHLPTLRQQGLSEYRWLVHVKVGAWRLPYTGPNLVPSQSSFESARAD
jgi:hypothetical protein